MKARMAGVGWVSVGGWGYGSGVGGFALENGELQLPARKDLFADPFPRYGRLDDFSRLGLAAITLALRDAGLEDWSEKRPIGVVAATYGGCIVTDVAYYATLVEFGGALVSPNLFAYTLANTFLGEAAIRFGLTGGSWVVDRDGDGELRSLEMALESLAAGENQTMLAGICDLPSPCGLSGPAPGAIFAVLQRPTASDGDRPLLTWTNRPTLNGRPLDDWRQLVAACRACGPATTPSRRDDRP